MSDGTLTTAQVAARLHKPVRTIQRWIATGRLKAEKLPGQTGAYLIKESEVERLEEAEPEDQERAS